MKLNMVNLIILYVAYIIVWTISFIPCAIITLLMVGKADAHNDFLDWIFNSVFDQLF
jgi:hypothetical protein